MRLYYQLLRWNNISAYIINIILIRLYLSSLIHSLILIKLKEFLFFMFKIFKFKSLFQNKTKVAKGRKILHGEAGCCSPFFFFLFLPVETATSHHPTKVAVGWCVGVRSTKTTRPDTLHLRREELLLATKADGGKNSSRPSAATLRAAYNACDELGPSGGHHSWPSPPPFIANQSLRRRLRLR